MEQAICDYVKTCAEPDFFHHADDPLLQQAHEEIRRSIEEATETITIMMDIRLVHRAEKVFASIGWTVEEALILFLYWCMDCPEQLAAWAKKHGIEDEISISDSGAMALRQKTIDAYTAACGETASETDEGETQCTTSPETPTETLPASHGSVNDSSLPRMT